jgi:hypothetical protein
MTTNIFEKMEVIEPKTNTMKYENGVNESGQMGTWAYIKEMPTTRVWGVDEDDACIKLMCLIINVDK